MHREHFESQKSWYRLTEGFSTVRKNIPNAPCLTKHLLLNHGGWM